MSPACGMPSRKMNLPKSCRSSRGLDSRRQPIAGAFGLLGQVPDDAPPRYRAPEPEAIPQGAAPRSGQSETSLTADALLLLPARSRVRGWLCPPQLAWVPDPLTATERAAGYPWRLSVYQAEFSDNVIFHRTHVLNRVYEELLRDHLHLEARSYGPQGEGPQLTATLDVGLPYGERNPERVLGVKLKTYPAPSRKRVTLAYVCFDAGPRGTVAVRVAASDSPSWTLLHGAPVPFNHARHFFPHDVTDPSRYSECAP
jgi:hypothetical protein